MRRARSIALLPLALSAAACARGSDSLEVFFTDELVEAPARSAQVVVLSGATCNDVLSVPHDASPPPGQVLLRTSTTYPIDPNLELLDNVPRGSPIALEIAVYDDHELLIARACEVVTLDPSNPVKLKIQMHALPQCPDKPPTALDLILVLDTSTSMAVADSENQRIADLQTKIVDGMDLPQGSTWSIVVHGHLPATQILAPTESPEEMKAAIGDLITADTGHPLIYDAMYLATGLARARAVCTRKPALLVLLGGPDGGSERVLEDAIVGVVGERGDATDDIYSFAIGMTLPTYDTLNEMIPEGLGEVTSAETQGLRTTKMVEAALALRALVP